LRIRSSDNPLDGTAVHPESYPLVEKMASDLGVPVRELMKNEGLIRKLDQGRYISERAGAATLQDILEELSRPGRDPRAKFEAFSFAPGIDCMAFACRWATLLHPAIEILNILSFIRDYYLITSWPTVMTFISAAPET